jgi:hypothetical protein
VSPAPASQDRAGPWLLASAPEEVICLRPPLAQHDQSGRPGQLVPLPARGSPPRGGGAGGSRGQSPDAKAVRHHDEQQLPVLEADLLVKEVSLLLGACQTGWGSNGDPSVSRSAPP